MPSHALASFPNLIPMRELAAQIHDNIASYAKCLPLKSSVVFGDVKINPQMQKLHSGTDILVATPRVIADLEGAGEVDRMLDLVYRRY